MTFGQGAHRVRLVRRFDTWPAGRHPLMTVAGGALLSALLRWRVSRASGGYSKHARSVTPASAVTVLPAAAGARAPWTGRGRGGSPPRQRETRAARSAVPGAPPSLRAGASRRTRGRRRPPGGRGGAHTLETAGTRPRSPRSG